MPMIARRHSKKREAIYERLQHRTDHPTCEILYGELKEEFPSLSLGTVYRNLMQMADEGRIQALDVGDGTQRFDADIKPHPHFICRCCHKVMDIKMRPQLAHRFMRRRAYIQGRPEKITLTVRGVCDLCLKK